MATLKGVVLGGLLAVLVTIASFAVTEPAAVEEPPQYDALVLPLGAPPLNLTGISRYHVADNEVVLIIGGQKMSIVGAPVIIWSNVEAAPSPLLESNFDSTELESRGSLLASR